jgi:hypothetical protein
MIRDQIRVLNESYNGRTGGANTGFGFDLVGVTRYTSCARSIRRAGSLLSL